MAETGYKANLKVWRGDAGTGALTDYQVEVNEGEVVLDVLHRLQATQTGDLAIRWNCKAGKCGSCSMEINGRPRLACMTRMSTYTQDETLTVTPLRTFPVIRDLVTDVAFKEAEGALQAEGVVEGDGLDGDVAHHQPAGVDRRRRAGVERAELQVAARGRDHAAAPIAETVAIAFDRDGRGRQQAVWIFQIGEAREV